VLYAVAVILSFALPYIVYRIACLPTACPSLLARGWLHRKRGKVHDYFCKSGKPFQLFSMWTNMHEKSIAGPGLCLYYNSLVFCGCMMLVAACVSLGTHIYRPLPDALAELNECAASAQEQVASVLTQLRQYQSARMWSLFLLWALFCVCGVLHGCFQRGWYAHLDSRTDSMSDLATRVVGFPRDAGEAEIEEFFNSIGAERVKHVSIAYDYLDDKERVEFLLSELVRAAEARRSQTAASTTIFAAFRDEMHQVTQRSTNSGNAFAVFNTEDMRIRWESDWRLSRPLFRGKHPIEIYDVASEPHVLVWSNFGVSTSARWVRGVREVAVACVCCLLLGLIVYAPTAQYVFQRTQVFAQVGADAVTRILGLLVSITNGVCYVIVDRCSQRVGFVIKGHKDIFNLVGCVVIVGVNTAYNLAITCSAVQAAARVPPGLQRLESTQVELDMMRVRETLGDSLWEVLVPSVLVVPYIVYVLLTYVLSWPTLLAYYVSIPLWPIYQTFDIRTKEDVSVKEAEAALEACPMQIEFDYASNVCVIATGFTILFVESPHMHKVFGVLVVWFVLTYWQQKYCHLRLAKLVDYSTPWLDECATYLWGIPVAMVAAASARWATLCYGLVWWCPAMAFAVSGVLYAVVLHSALRCVSIRDDRGCAPHDKVRRAMGYDWLNTNPIAVLKAHARDPQAPVVFYRRGKEFLQADWEGAHAQQGEEPADLERNETEMQDLLKSAF